MNKAKKDWLLAILLTLPMVFFYGRHYLNHVDSIHPTGFIAYDNVSYIAYAKEYLDADDFHLLYANPLNDSADHPRIYFQTQNIFFIVLLALGIAPGLVIVLFNWLCAILSFRMAIAIYDHLSISKKFRTLLISFFCWGGGLLALAGIPVAFVKQGNLDFLDRIFYLDPAWGWWGLNFGRGHFMSSEGYFHFLFLSAIFCILKKKWTIALIVAFILSLSHPFTGIELLAILAGWSGLEKIFYRSGNVSWKFFIGILLILAFHILYYLIYLNNFPEHRSVSEQYSLNWRLRFFHMIPAYCLVGGLALFSIWKWKREWLKNPNNRLFLAWFIVAFTLANHEIFMKPMQPIHFTRGYIWTSLFLMGLPTLHFIFENAKTKWNRYGLVLFTILMFSDNFLWITNYIRTKALSASVSHITNEHQEILKLLDNASTNKTLIIGRDKILPYLSTVHTKAYPWISHPYTTPFTLQKEIAYNSFISENKMDSAWIKRDLIFIFRKNVPEEVARSQSMPFAVETIAETPSYIIQRGSF